MTYFLLEVIKLSVIVACKKLPLEAKDFFIFAEISKLVVIGLVMIGLHSSSVNTSNPVQIEDTKSYEVYYDN
jgi:hypothetical protein